MNLLGCLIVFVSSHGSPAHAAETVKPEISEAGRAQIAESMESLEDAMNQASSNVAHCQSNIKVIQSELSDLDKLENEFNELRQEYKRYLATAKQEADKNEQTSQKLTSLEAEAIRKLRALKKESRTVDDETIAAREQQFKTKILEMRKEHKERQKWKADTLQKASLAKKRGAQLGGATAQIANHRSALQQKLAYWTKQEQKYQKLTVELQKKKQVFRQLARDN